MVVLSEVKNMFWGVTVDGGKHYTQTVERSFHISMAALEPLSNPASAAKPKAPISVMIQHDKAEFMLCTLEHGRVYQQPLDLNFTEGEEVTFFLNGSGIVHLTGYLIDDDQLSNLEGEDFLEEMSDSEEVSSSDSDSDTAPALMGPDDDTDKKRAKLKRKQKLVTEKPSKKSKTIMEQVESDDDDDDSDDEDFEIDDDDDDDDDQDGFGDFGSLDDDDDDVDDDDDDDDDDMFDEEEDEEEMPKKQKTPKQKQKETPKSENKQKTRETIKQESQQNGAETGESKKKKKKKKKKNKGVETPDTSGDKQQPKETPKMKKVLAGGLIQEELKVGHGPEAKSGKMVHVYYAGKLAKSGKQFDSCSSGKPFRFRLGKSEVIKGWDMGLQGMKVGGKRRLTVPPSQGYGNQKQGPIPPNSTLIFDIELKSVS